MKTSSYRSLSTASLPMAALLISATAALAQSTAPAVQPVTSPSQISSVSISLPPSSVANAADVGQLAHTHLQVRAAISGPHPNYGNPFPGLWYESPASLGCVYGLVAKQNGCNPNTVSNNPSGGSKAIAIVDPYADDAFIFGDLDAYDGQFGVAARGPKTLTVVHAPSGNPSTGFCAGPAPGPLPKSAAGSGWDIEADTDVQMAHAMAPNATIFLVEAQSNSIADLFCAVTVASGLIAGAGGGEVSMSWGSGEFCSGAGTQCETYWDQFLQVPGVVYLASTGDSPGTGYPSVSPYVLAAGGLSDSRDPSTGDLIKVTNWQAAGGGPSIVEPLPSYQVGVTGVGATRSTPDMSFDANPATGVWVANSSYIPVVFGLPPGLYWFVVGGTSVAAPALAGIVNAAGSFAASTGIELAKLYSDPGYDFIGINGGTCGVYDAYTAGGLNQFDFCTGLGGVRGTAGK